jgi:uncharacterized protein (TIGR03067 family)
MTRLHALGLIFLAAAFPSGLAEEDAKESPREAARKDLEKLQGTWNLVSMEVEGHAVPPEDFRGWNAVYEGDTLTLRVGNEVRRRGIETLDAARNPKAINTWDLDGPYEDLTVPGIYALDGDSLKLCFARPGQPRPTEFTTTRGTAFLYVVYERKKP